MTRRAWSRWDSFSAEDRAVLKHLYSYAIQYPQYVSEYERVLYRLRPSCKQIQIHKFKFSIANFIIVTTLTTERILDLWLDDENETDIAAV